MLDVVLPAGRAELPWTARWLSLRLAMVISVLLHHAMVGAQALGTGPHTDAWQWLTHLLAESLAGVRIPLLFLGAGLLFFRDGPLDTQQLQAKWRRRGRSLALPFVLWSLLMAGLVAAGQRWSLTAASFGGSWPHWQDQHGALAWLDLLLGGTRAPFIYPLWFLRDLVLLCLLAPGLQWLDQRAGGWGLALVLLPASLAWWVGQTSLAPLSVDGMLFFSLGACCGLRRQATRWLARVDRWGPLLLAVCLPLALWRASWPLGLFPGAWDRPYALLAMGALLWLAGRRAPGARGGRAGAFAFVLFLMHEPVLSVVRKLAAPLLGGAGAAQGLLLGLLSAGLTLLLLGLCWQALQRHAGRALGWLSGGRSEAHP
jgi:hypothetical protein